MIISASRRTDVPAFFSEWLMEAVAEGHVDVRNPFNPRRARRVSLRPDDVEAMVFWSKDPRPLVAHLDELDSRGYRYYFQYTVNDYGPPLEPNLPDLKRRLDTFRTLAARLGPERVVWRYDPIIVSSRMPLAHHVDRIGRIASSLTGCSKRLVISFMDFYSKTSRRLSEVSRATGERFVDIALPEHRAELQDLARQVREIADGAGLEVSSCAEAVDLAKEGITWGACIDGELVERVFGVRREFRKDRGQRPECGCVESVDIGTYNTCRHLCAYCYAISGISPSKKDRQISADSTR